ncbi:hypothetical protein FPSE_12423 [Fusarium pseudograminearum CS3096]|uniref:Peptidase S1 domain-containing protein n=2 Tax=Fusarium pseudograminearum TaxID=101028 RepID=K3U896_FUSPC|nr:hypothetical protein FPSE_12423 [Fusarium pseudograminearum CS3096]EKJ67401.1 hypothetical protein FPSE_12423 [Fusarium pseudograminearum CS3096]KAF0644893.1 hypothetical protein FPSE5266_12423 [Fusarium pseudograminearum]CEG02896.1 unnamed protein product [Fusarium pseudograminearum CS3487]
MDPPKQEDPVITVISARYRAAWPELRPLPLVWASDPPWSTPLLQQRRYEIEETVIEILERLGLEFDDGNAAEVWFANQHMASQPDTCVPTIVIYSSWSENKQTLWETVVREVALVLYHMFKGSEVAYDSIHIDMQSPELGGTIYYEPVNDCDDLCDSWDDVRALVHQRLEAFKATERSMVAICLLHYRESITIYIAVDYSSDETGWLEVIADIKANMDRYKRGWTDVQVHIQHNAGASYSFDMLPPAYDSGATRKVCSEGKLFYGDYQQAVKPGDDFGADTSSSDGSKMPVGFGTIGCFIEIKTKSNPVWKRYALTSYHAVRPALPGFRLEIVGEGSKPAPPEPNSECWNADSKGYAPGHSATPPRFESPSRVKHNFTTWHIADRTETSNRISDELEAELQRTGKTRTQKTIDSIRKSVQEGREERQKKIDFFNDGKQALGTLFAASGYMRRVSVDGDRHKARLDWALIDVAEHRQGSNRLPSWSAWEQKYESVRITPYLLDESLLEETQSDGPDNSYVWKLSAANGPTVGTYCRNRIACAVAEDKHLRDGASETAEYIYQPDSGCMHGTYCAKGDSGSVVFDKNGKVIGLYSAGIKIRQSFGNEGFGIVTPIEHIFQDIKDFLGDVTAIRVAMD